MSNATQHVELTTTRSKWTYWSVWIICGIVAVACLVGAATSWRKFTQETTSTSKPCVGGDYVAPGDAKTLKALTEHYAGMCSYKVVWNVKVNPAIDPKVLNAAGVYFGTRNFAQALQDTLFKPLEQGIVQMPQLVGCFDEKAKTVTVIESDTQRSSKQCALAPMGW